MRRSERIDILLRDAEIAFRKEPKKAEHNHYGLCWFFLNHPLLFDFTFKSKRSYLDEIFGAVVWETYLFTQQLSQEKAWRDKVTGYNYERADWCEKQRKELRNRKIIKEPQ